MNGRKARAIRQNLQTGNVDVNETRYVDRVTKKTYKHIIAGEVKYISKDMVTKRLDPQCGRYAYQITKKYMKGV